MTTLGRFALGCGPTAIEPPPTAKARALLAYLIRERRAALPRERLIDLLWPDADLERGRGNLKTAIWSIRRALRDARFDPDAYVRTSASAVRWIGEVEVDAETLVAAAKRGDASAIALYGGAYLDGLDDEWIVVEREAVECAYETLLEAGLEGPQRAENARRLLARNAYNERAWTAAITTECDARRFGPARVLLERARRTFAEADLALSADFAARFAALGRPRDRVRRFVGREAEIDTLVRARESGGLVVVAGQAGIGKSALLEAAIDTLERAGTRCVRVGPGATRLGLDALAAHFGVPSEASPLARSSGRAVGEAIVARAVGTPLYVVDDYDRLTGDVREAIDVVIARAACCIVSTRPEGIGDLIAPGLPRIATMLELQPLDRETVVRALHAEYELDPEVADAVYARSGGFPFAIDALVRALSSGAASNDVAPEIRTVIEQRLRARGDVPASVAALLAIEPDATTDDLAAALRVPEATILDAIDDLSALGILVDADDGLRFAHDLFALGALKIVSGERRRRAHRFFAERLEARPERPDLARVGDHLAACGRAIDAARAYARAASSAHAARRYADASDAYERALDVVDGDGRADADDLRFTLRCELARVLDDSGRSSEAQAQMDAVLDAVDGTASTAHFDAFHLGAAIAYRASDFVRAERFGSRALAIATDLGDDERRALALAWLARTAARGARRESARSLAAAAFDAERAEPIDVEIAYSAMLATAASGAYAEAYATVERAIPRIVIAERRDEIFVRMLTASAEVSVHRYDAALARAREALAFIRMANGRTRRAPTSVARMEWYATRLAAGVCALTGALDESIAISASLLSGAFVFAPVERGHALDFYVHALLDRGRAGDEALAERLLAALPDRGLANAEPFVATARARLAVGVGRADAPAAIERAARLCETDFTTDRHERPRVLVLLAEVARSAGETERHARLRDLAAGEFAWWRAACGAYWGGPPTFEAYRTTLVR